MQPIPGRQNQWGLGGGSGGCGVRKRKAWKGGSPLLKEPFSCSQGDPSAVTHTYGNTQTVDVALLPASPPRWQEQLPLSHTQTGPISIHPHCVWSALHPQAEQWRPGNLHPFWGINFQFVSRKTAGFHATWGITQKITKLICYVSPHFLNKLLKAVVSSSLEESKKKANVWKYSLVSAATPLLCEKSLPPDKKSICIYFIGTSNTTVLLHNNL